MNIFYLDDDPKKAAQAHYDIHVRKMILETAQLLSTAHRVLDGEETTMIDKAGRRRKTYIFKDNRENLYYKSTHINHPSAKWVRESSENYKWAYSLYIELLKEYEYRFGKSHKTSELKESLFNLPMNIKKGPFTNPPNAMDKEFIVNHESALYNYRNYYSKGKRKFMKYTKRKSGPSWLKD